MNLLELLNTYKGLITEHLTFFLQEKNKNAAKDDLFYTEVIEKLMKFSIGGKMIRGGLVLLSYEMNGGVIDKKILNAAVAIELIHSALCIHDDIMDNDMLRRGKPTIVSQYKDSVKNAAPYYAQSMAICVGDVAIFLAYELLSNVCDNVKTNSLMIQCFTRELTNVGTAQMMDLYFAQPQSLPSIQQAMLIYANKSGGYTFVLPLYIGQLLASDSLKFVPLTDDIGKKLGIIFQIKDDELGFSGDEKTIGKPVGSDIRENKKTLIYLLLYQSVNEKEKTYLNKCFGNPNLTTEDITEVKKLASKYQVIERVHQQMETLQIQVNILLENSEINQQYKKALVELVEFNLKRNK